jgi:hypothetical protein
MDPIRIVPVYCKMNHLACTQYIFFLQKFIVAGFLVPVPFSSGYAEFDAAREGGIRGKDTGTFVENMPVILVLLHVLSCGNLSYPTSTKSVLTTPVLSNHHDQIIYFSVIKNMFFKIDFPPFF